MEPNTITFFLDGERSDLVFLVDVSDEDGVFLELDFGLVTGLGSGDVSSDVSYFFLEILDRV